MPRLPDHPDIARVLDTGYPHLVKEPEPVYCTDCCLEMTGEDTVFIYDGEPCCENCFRDRIEEEFDMSYIAHALGIRTKSAAEYGADQTRKE